MGVGEYSEKIGSFFQGRRETTFSNDTKGCNELIPFPSNLLWLHILGLGCNPGKTLVHFLVEEAAFAWALLSSGVPSLLH